MGKSLLFKILLFILFSPLSISILFAQTEPNVKFGKYTTDDFKNSYSDAYLNASAIVLYDLGESYFNKLLEVEYTRHVRIRILKESGYHWGICKLFYNSGKFKESVKEIEGYTAYTDSNGQIIVKELDSDDILDEQLTKNKSAKSFTLPAMQPGCIIEYRYKIKSNYYNNFPRQWKFQYDDPVLWSEYRTEIPHLYQFTVIMQRNDLLSIDTQKEFNQRYTNKEADNVNVYLSGFRKRMVMQNIPPLYKEPYMKSVENYRAKVIYHLTSYTPLDSLSEKFTSSWEDICKTLMKSEDFGGCLDGTNLIEKKVKELTDTIPDKNKKLIAIYNYVKNSIVWNGQNSIYADELDEVLQNKKGDSGDINLLLASMLKKAGIEVYPVLISTRENGTVFPDYPLLEQFNRVLVYANTGRNERILDATDKLRPYYLLPDEALNDNGLMVLPDSTEWVKISSAGTDLSIKVASVAINRDGSINGIMRITKEEYSALSARHTIQNKKDNIALGEILQSEKTGINGSSLKIINAEEIEKPLIIESKLSSNTYYLSSEKLMNINPNFLGRIDYNPFYSEDRFFSVDYMHPIDIYYKVNIALPDSFALQDYPKPISIDIRNNAGYTREITVNGNFIQFSTRFFIAKATFSPDEYYELKDFYDRVVILDNDQIVLRKKD